MSDKEQVQTAFQFFWEAMSHHKKKVIAMMTSDFFQAALILMVPFVIKDLVNAVEAFDRDGSQSIWETVRQPFYIFIGIVIGHMVASRTSGFFLALLAPVIRIKPRQKIFRHLKDHSVNFFQTSYSGSLGNKINEALNGMTFCLWSFTFEVFPIIVKFVVSVVLLFMTSFNMGFVMLCWVCVHFSVVTFLAIRQGRMMEAISRERSVITGGVVDVATNMHTVKAFAHEEYEQERLDDLVEGEISAIKKLQVNRETAAYFDNIMGVILLSTLMVMAINTYEAGLFSLGEVAFVFSLNLLIIQQSSALLWAMTHFLEYIGQLRDGVTTVMKPHKVLDDGSAKPLSVSSGSIAYRKIKFAYPEVPDKPIFNDFDLIVPKGQKIGLVGTSGAGKSSLVNLLLRFYDLQDGAITIDSQDISSVTQQSVRQAISIIPQDTSLFHRSMMDNIRYGLLDATDEQVMDAAKKAHAHDFIMELEAGYDTMVGERGVKLSGGQRQRIAIARAVLKDAPILILDEATSALDSESEKAIQESLHNLMQGKTVIAIAHRLSTLSSMDRIIVMQHGQISEDGTHDALLEKGGQYARLWSMQSGGFLKEG